MGQQTRDKEQLGLVVNVLCLVPSWEKSGMFYSLFRRMIGAPPDQLTSFREFNFSAWKSAEHAHNWYKGSKKHAEILAKHTGKMSCFGNVLASLKPARPLL